MTIRKRLARSNLVMLVVPVAVAAALLAAGYFGAALLLQYVYLPRIGLTMSDMHEAGEMLEEMFSGLNIEGLKLMAWLYFAAVAVALLAAVAFTNWYLTRSLFRHIEAPLDALVQGVQRVRDGDLETPIAYAGADEFKAACDTVDEMAARLRATLDEQQRQQQKKQELIAGMSHDLKSPLAAIRAYTEALLEGVARDESARRRYLQTIYARETELEALVNRLFELAKLGASEYPVQLQSLALREELTELAESGSEGLAVSLEKVGGERVQADKELLARIVHNLFDNSRKYGATHVRLSSAAADGSVELRFADDGPGVPESQLDSLFDAFYRGDAARTKPAGGSGLGLAVVKEAAERMHGTAKAENAPGGGLCVVLTLPAGE